MHDRPEPSAFLRLFVGLAIEEPVRDALRDLQDRLRRSGAHVSWTPPANLHLTLVFLGDVERDAMETVSRALAPACAARAPFAGEVAGVGWFGGRRPHVVWAGFRGDVQKLLDLQAGVAENIRRLAFRIDERPYVPHLTVGRVRSARGSGALIKALEDVCDAAFGTTTFDRVSLYRSVLKPGGAEYEILRSFRLDAADSSAP